MTTAQAMMAAPREGAVRVQTMRIMALALAVLVAVAGGVINAPAAAGHGGPYELTVAPDGAGGIQVFATYEGDGHTVEAVMDVVAEAVADDGRTAGPVSLVSSPEGQGRWVTERPFLDNGDWTVTVSTTTPEEASTTVEFTVAPIEAPVAPEPVEETSASPEPSAAEQATESEPTGEEGGVGGVPAVWLIGALLALAAVAGGVYAWSRRRA